MGIRFKIFGKLGSSNQNWYSFTKDWNDSNSQELPEFFVQALKYIENKYITHEGIYRTGLNYI